MTQAEQPKDTSKPKTALELLAGLPDIPRGGNYGQPDIKYKPQFIPGDEVDPEEFKKKKEQKEQKK